VAESSLKVSPKCTCDRIDLLGQQSERTRARAQVVIEVPRVLRSTLPGQVVDKPLAAEQKCAFARGHAVRRFVGEIAIQQAATGAESILDPTRRGNHAWVVRRDYAAQR
jgi:hypothetical protein